MRETISGAAGSDGAATGGAHDAPARRAQPSGLRSVLRGLDRATVVHALVVVGLVVARQLMCHWLPTKVLSYAAYDDNLMVSMARTIADGQWLGPYGQLTLVKGVGFPLFLVLAHALGVAYLDLVTLTYSLSCVVFVHAVRELVPRGWQRLLLLCVLMFAPVMASATAVQRIYRCSITPALVLLVFATLVRLFLLAADVPQVAHAPEAQDAHRPRAWLRPMAAWAVLGGVSLAWLWNTREDGVWIVPAAAILLGCTVVACVRRRGPAWQRVVAVALALVPFALLALSSTTIAAINAQWYGQDLAIELSAGNFPRAIRALYAIDAEEGERDYGPRVTVSDQILTRAIEASPTLKSIEGHLWERWDYWKQFGGKPKGQPKNGWFFWGFRDAVSEAGLYDTAERSEAFYAAVADELEAAMERGELTERPTMPSALMPPLKDGYLDDLVLTGVRLGVYVAQSQGTQPALVESETWVEGVEDDIAFLGARVIPVGGQPTERMRAAVAVCDAVDKAYHVLSPVLGAVGALGFVLAAVSAMRSRRTSHGTQDRDQGPHNRLLHQLFVQAVLAVAFFTLLAGLSYTEVFSFDAVNPMYASGAYPLYLAFGALGVAALWEALGTWRTAAPLTQGA